MNCSICNSPITSAITKDKCTRCYFGKSSSSSSAPKGRLGNESESNSNVKINQENPTSESNSDRTIGTIESQSSAQESAPIESEPYNIKKENQRSVKNQEPVKGIKYCQSCIERGYGLVPATREFKTGQFICQDCFEPLLQNTLGYSVERAEIERIIPEIDGDKPILEQIYNLLEIPDELRFTKSEDVLSNRNQIFNYHAKALVNCDPNEIIARVEQFQIILFQIKIGMEPLTDYINRVKAEKRKEAQLVGIEKSKKEVGKKPSKAKMSKDEQMAKALGMNLDTYLEMAKKARESEFNKLTGQ